MGNPLYLSYDGDGCGKKVGRAIMANDEEKLHEISAKIDLGHEIVKHWVAQQGGKVISGGGDEGSFRLPKESVDHIEQLRKDYHFATGITISVGIGNSLSEAGRSLLAAKFRGKDQVAYYDESVEKDIKRARSKVKKGKASQEEYKLAEAYLEKTEGKNMPAQMPEQNEADCPYCQQTDGIDPDHCKYCHDAETAPGQDDCPYCTGSAPGAHGDDCPYCQQNPTHVSEHTDDCPYCKEAPQQAAPQQGVPYDEKVPGAPDQQEAEQNRIGSPDSTNQSAPPGSPQEKEMYNRMDMNPPAHGKPQVGDNSPQGEGQANPSDAGAPLPDKTGAIVPAEGAHSKDALIGIAQTIEGQTADGQPEAKPEAKQIDDTAIQNQDMQGNVSRPPGYDSNTPSDTGMPDSAPQDDNSPNLSQVLRDGLDDHADTLQRQKVIQMVSHALQGFKASKAVLEQAKMQAPQLYSASIAMLQAMIEMAKMLGFGGDSAGQPEAGLPAEALAPQQGQAQPQGDEWKDPFPKHPDHGGEQKPGHAAPSGVAAQAPKAVRQ